MLARSLPVPLDPASCRSPSRSRSRTAERRHGPGALLRAHQPGVPRPGRRAAAADRAVARRPDRRGDAPPCRSTARSSPRAASPSSTSTTAARPGYGRPYRDALRASGASSTSTTASRRPGSSSTAATSTPTRLAIRGGSAGGYTTLAALTFQPRRVRGRDQPLRHRRPRADPPGRPQVRVALRRGPGRPVDRGGPRGLPRSLADPPPRTGCGRRCSCSRASTTRSCRRRSST